MHDPTANAQEKTPTRVLKEIFGFDGFRPGQEDVIRAALAGRDVLAVMPTSGGKSLCYQVPALMGEGLTVVVSPLVSLMKDQIDALRDRCAASALASASRPAAPSAPGPEAVAALHSNLPAAERRRIERRLLSGEVKILYVAPERLRALEFVVLLKRARASLVVVDEAHCISEWGHSFRPEYLFLRSAFEDFGASGRGERPPAKPHTRPPIMALTATADPKVRHDIVELLGLREPEVVRTGFDRPNLRYRVRWVADDGRAARGNPQGTSGRLQMILEALREGERPAIVYAHTRRRCEELAAGLTATGVPAEAYHAGMSAAERDAVQGRFMANELPVIVATVAFGMGVDKPNVRTMIHAGVPASIPAYVQEAGRDGRDGDPAFSTVLFSPEELEHRKELAGLNLTTAQDARTFFEALREISTPEEAGPNRGKLRANPTRGELSALGGLGKDTAADVLRALEATGRIRRRYDLWAKVRVRAIRRPGLGHDPTKVGPDSSGAAGRVLDALRARGAGTAVPVPLLAREAGLSPAATQASLSRLMASGRIEATPKGQVVDLLLKPGPLSRRELAELTRRFERRSAQEVRHLEDVAAYASLTTCRRERLLFHFGGEAAELVAPCDGCDVCQGSEDHGGPSLLGRLISGFTRALGIGRGLADR